MPDFTSLRPHVYTTGAVIYAFKHTLNETTIYGSHNAAMHASTGHTHSGSTGDGSPIKIKGAGVGLLTPSYDNTANNSTIVFPYTGASVRAAYEDIAVPAGSFKNLGLTFSANVLSVTNAAGAALSALTPGYVSCPLLTGGLYRMFKIETAQTINSAAHASPQILGRWGTTASVAWGSAMPIYIGLANKDDTDAGARFFLSRNPCMTTTPASTNNIGVAGTAPSSSSQNNIVLFGTTANTGYDSKPCVIIGSIQMTCDNSSGGSWTVGSLVQGRDGFGLLQKGVVFTFPKLQNGATLNYLSAGGAATTLAFEGTTATSLTYSLDPITGMCNFWMIGGTRSAADAGAGNLNVHLPYASLSPYLATTGWNRGVVATAYMIGALWIQAGATYGVRMGVNGVLTVGEFTNAGDAICNLGNIGGSIQGVYKVF